MPRASTSRQLRFGVLGPTGLRSPYWTVKAAAKKAELFVSCEPTGRFFHLSYHEGSWHSKVVTERRDHLQVLPQPAELAPGLRRALQVRIPPGAVDWPRTADAKVRWVLQPEASDEWTLFDLILEAQGAPMDSWPGRRSMGTRFVGRVSLIDGTTAVVVTWTVLGTPGAATLRADDDQLVGVREAIRGGGVRGLVIGSLEDGTPYVIESRFALPE